MHRIDSFFIALLGALAFLAGCSFGAGVDTDYIRACTLDSDCPAGEVCAQTGFCGPAAIFGADGTIDFTPTDTRSSDPDQTPADGTNPPTDTQVQPDGTARPDSRSDMVGTSDIDPPRDTTTPQDTAALPDTSAMDSGGGSTTVSVRIVGDENDSEEDLNNGNIDLQSFDLDLVTDVNKAQIVGLRFTNLMVPQGATITSAFVQFTVDEATADAATLELAAEDADDTSPFTSSSGDITARPVTTQSVSWPVPPWNTAGDSGPDQRSPNIAPVVQAVISRSGWQSGNALVVLITGTGDRVAEAYDGEPQLSAELTVTYTQ